jgi:hypothetical protein
VNVIVTKNSHPDVPLTTLFPPRKGWKQIVFMRRWVAGDWVDPQNGNWFKPPYPSEVIRQWIPPERARLYFAWNIFGWCGYVGAKIYGVDSPEYKNWLPPHEVYNGSLAFCMTIRLRASDHS